MEATGVYFRPLASYLAARAFPLYVVNPKQVKDFARSTLSRNKTDRVDARRIAEFLSRFQVDLTPYEVRDESFSLLALLVRFADGLMVQRVGTLNRSHAVSVFNPSILSELRLSSEVLAAERRRIMTLARQVVNDSPLLSQWFSVLLKLPGFGEVTVLRFFAYAQDLRAFPTPRHFASYTGLTPEIFQSGDSLAVSHISRVGSSSLRAVLYLCAVSASRTDTPEGAYYRSLVARGKPKKVAMCALAHKLSRIAWTVCVKS